MRWVSVFMKERLSLTSKRKTSMDQSSQKTTQLAKVAEGSS